MSTQTQAFDLAQHHGWTVVDNVELTDGTTFATWRRNEVRVTTDFDRAGRCIHLSRWLDSGACTHNIRERRGQVLLAWLALPLASPL